MLVSKVLPVKDENGIKRITPQLAFDLPDQFVSLAYDHQSLAYVETRELVGMTEIERSHREKPAARAWRLVRFRIKWTQAQIGENVSLLRTQGC